MRVLVISDQVESSLYDYFNPKKLEGVELIISCGDLKKSYLEFLVTMVRCPLIYVPGNHDDAFLNAPPEGCVCIDDDIFTYKGIRFLGLGGSHRYKRDGVYQYTERQMKIRVLRLFPKILFKKGFDVMVTHAPAFGQGDLDNIPHKGFKCFLKLIEKYKPGYLFHGHIHTNYDIRISKEREYMDCNIINACGYRIMDIFGEKA